MSKHPDATEVWRCDHPESAPNQWTAAAPTTCGSCRLGVVADLLVMGDLIVRDMAGVVTTAGEYAHTSEFVALWARDDVHIARAFDRWKAS